MRKVKKAKRKAKKAKPGNQMSADYDFSRGTRGKYARRYAQGTNLVALAPDVARIFPDSQSVNEALRVLAQVARRGRKTSA